MQCLICERCGREIPDDAQKFKGALKHADGSHELDFDLCIVCHEEIAAGVRQVRLSVKRDLVEGAEAAAAEAKMEALDQPLKVERDSGETAT